LPRRVGELMIARRQSKKAKATRANGVQVSRSVVLRERPLRIRPQRRGVG
jgi:hypothetical protein